MRDWEVVVEGNQVQILGIINYDMKSNTAQFTHIEALMGKNTSLNGAKWEYTKEGLFRFFTCMLFAAGLLFCGYQIRKQYRRVFWGDHQLEDNILLTKLRNVLPAGELQL